MNKLLGPILIRSAQFRMFNPLLIIKNLTIFQGTALAVA